MHERARCKDLSISSAANAAVLQTQNGVVESPRKRAAKRVAIALLLLILLPVVYQLCAPTPAPGELVQRSLGARIALGCALGISYVLLLVSLYRLIVGTTVGNLARALKVLGACAMVIGVLFGGVGTWFTVDLLSGKLDHAGTEGSSHHHFDWD